MKTKIKLRNLYFNTSKLKEKKENITIFKVILKKNYI